MSHLWLLFAVCTCAANASSVFRTYYFNDHSLSALAVAEHRDSKTEGFCGGKAVICQVLTKPQPQRWLAESEEVLPSYYNGAK